MEGDPGTTVERLASVLLSVDTKTHQEGLALLHAVILKARDAGAGAASFARLAQELAVYQGGAFLRRVLEQGLGLVDKTAGELEVFLSLHALSSFTASRVFAERCLKESGAQEVFWKLYNQTMFIARCQRESGDSHPWIMVSSLECLVNFARASKAFRDSIRDSPTQQDVFHQFQDLLRPAFLASLIPPVFAQKVRFYLASLAVSLAYSADSQMWAIDGGLLKLLAVIYEQSPLAESSKASQRSNSPAFRCNQVLLWLSLFEPTAEKLRAHNVLEGFRPHKRKINSAEPEVHPWSLFEKMWKAPDQISFVFNDRESLERCKRVGEVFNGRFWIPVVCSWKLCAAGCEPTVGKGFSKCARCQVARYCSKEHQKLHWASHKVHCKADSGQEEADPARNEGQ